MEKNEGESGAKFLLQSVKPSSPEILEPKDPSDHYPSIHLAFPTSATKSSLNESLNDNNFWEPDF